ncbi:MAG: SDR family NAD(P)-dependent oxidoreductase [Myxococcota bacterium]|nr:SDR family NAD(P)-dependent oxidoreductase [Myxococcota bacterium]
MMLDGKTAIVTGAGRGIGKEIARELARAGAKVIVHYNRSKESAEQLAAEIDGIPMQADLSVPEDCLRLIQSATNRLDILVNNAGINNDMLVLQMSDDDWLSVIDVNLNATFRLCRAASERMLRQRSGSIINITSISGITPNRGQANYAASKSAVSAFTRSLSKELAKKNVRCNCIAPGLIETDMLREMNPKALSEAKQRIPMRRPGKPIEIAKVVRFLASDDASYVTGQEWVVDGGLL